jgi:hypothetical protein
MYKCETQNMFIHLYVECVYICAIMCDHIHVCVCNDIYKCVNVYVCVCICKVLEAEVILIVFINIK